MAKMILTIEVVDITRKGEHLGFKVYINDFVQAAKLPRKPGDLKDPHPEELVFFNEEHGVMQNKKDHSEPVDYYTLTLVDSIQQALIDWQIWKGQGYKRAEE